MGTKLLHDLEVDEYLHDCVHVYPEALNEEFVRLPSDLAYWCTRASDAHRAYLEAKIELDRISAATFLTCRERLLSSGEKATEKMIDSTVTSDEAYLAARQAYLEAEVERERTRGVCEAIRAKRDMLISLGANHRAEMEHDPMIKARDVAARAMRDGG